MADRDRERNGSGPYTIRPFVASDIEAVRDLYEEVMNEQKTPEWLEWKYLENPAVEDVSMFIAEGEGGIVGIRPFYPVRMRYGDSPVAATCLVNAMVAPEHRGKGVFSELSDCALEYLSERNDLLFCFANSNSRPIYEHWGWTEISRMHSHFRIQNPGGLLTGGDAWKRGAGRLLTASARGYQAVLDSVSPNTTDVTVMSTDRIPASRLASLYSRSVPGTLHVGRDEEYYRWRLGAPNRETSVYIAVRDGGDVAALIVQSRTIPGGTAYVEVSDALPLEVDQDCVDAFAALLTRVVDDNPTADIISAPGTKIPDRLLWRHGFVSSARRPLSWLYDRLFDPLTLFSQPLASLPFDVGVADNWDTCGLTRNTN